MKEIKYCQELRSRFPNFPAFLLALYMIAIQMCVGLTFMIGFALSASGKRYMIIALQGIFLVVIPIAGWMADTKLGRTKAISLSLQLSWLGAVAQVVSHYIQYSVSHGVLFNMALYGLSGVALVLLCIGVGLFLANVYAYGMDQLQEGSNKQIRSFIHWVAGGEVVGLIIISYKVMNSDDSKPDTQFIIEIIALTAASIALSGHFLIQSKFHPSGVVQSSPYKAIFDVLKFSIRNKFMRNRSAFTYWESTSPSRIEKQNMVVHFLRRL